MTDNLIQSNGETGNAATESWLLRLLLLIYILSSKHQIFISVLKYCTSAV